MFRYDAKVKRIKDSIGLSQDMSWLGLDKWEIPRDQVVLNRKLGEGAFGTVYGGEALINNTWLAVAVKTLKIGSNAEDKVCMIKNLLLHLIIIFSLPWWYI